MTEETKPNSTSDIEKKLWYLNNYVLLRDYYDRTVSRIAARCVRKGNMAIEDYPFYNYTLDVLEEISEVGDYLLKNRDLYPYIEKKIVGGVIGLKKNLEEYKEELFKNSSPDMIKEDRRKEVEQMKEALGSGGDNKPSFDPTKGAGMSMDELMEKLISQQKSDDENKQKKMVKIKKPVGQPIQGVPQKNSTEG